jgi:hypothetical protein
MALTGALLIVRLVVSARDIAVAIGMISRFAFLANVVRAAHERDSLSVQFSRDKSMGGMKHIVYKYDDGLSDEMDFDARGLFNFEKGDIVSKHGMTWKVDAVEQQGADDRKQIPTVWVYLSRVLVS